MGAGYGAVKYYLSDEPVVTNTPVMAQKVSSTTGLSAVDIIKSVKPSVVSISTKVSGTAEYFGSFSVPYESNGVGSGVIFIQMMRRLPSQQITMWLTVQAPFMLHWKEM